MVSKINAFTKSYAKYLEHIAVTHATESMEAYLLESFDTIKILLSTLGFPVFKKVSKEQIAAKELFILSGRGIKAEGDLIGDGFVVFKGSQAKKECVQFCHEYLINLRQKLIQMR